MTVALKSKSKSNATKRIVLLVTEEQFWQLKTLAIENKKTLKDILIAPAMKLIRKKEAV